MDDYIYISTQFLKTDLSVRTAMEEDDFLVELARNLGNNDVVLSKFLVHTAISSVPYAYFSMNHLRETLKNFRSHINWIRENLTNQEILSSTEREELRHQLPRILGLCQDLTEMKYLVYSYNGNPVTQPIENAFNYERELVEVANRRLTMILKDLHSEGIISIKSYEEEYDEPSPYHDHINRYGRILNPIRRNRFNNKRSRKRSKKRSRKRSKKRSRKRSKKRSRKRSKKRSRKRSKKRSRKRSRVGNRSRKHKKKSKKRSRTRKRFKSKRSRVHRKLNK